MRATDKQRGFTLLEIMVVIVIIGVLASLVVWGSDQFWAEFVQPGRTCKPCVARGVLI